jgi:type VI protein secretion system component VasF
LALCKELLGYIRRKYNNVPIPGGELSLDGDTLVSDGKEEREALITQLREMLEETSKKALIEAKQNEAENQADLMRRIPTKIYIG